MRKTIIWDLDNTLYFETEEYKNKLNEATAAAAIKEFNVPLDFKEATEKVKESYATYRDGLEIFSREYGRAFSVRSTSFPHLPKISAKKF